MVLARRDLIALDKQPLLVKLWAAQRIYPILSLLTEAEHFFETCEARSDLSSNTHTKIIIYKDPLLS